MKFLKLEMLNLASLDRQEGEVINFEEGVLQECNIFSIVGPTGSGKSTILDAICLALYNRAPRYPKVGKKDGQKIKIFGQAAEGENYRLAPTDGRNILTRGKKNGYSKLTFIATDGTIYRAEWHVVFKTKNFDNTVMQLYKITVKDGKQTEEIADWNTLPQILGLEYEQFLRTVLIAQGSFADFLKEDEEHQYQLLEKLVGCKELYTNISAKIKQQNEAATSDYNVVAANYSAQENDILQENELTVVQERLNELEEEEKKAKEEIRKITEAQAWYASNEKYVNDIEIYQAKYNNANKNLEAIKDEIERLNIHDATLEAVAHYKDQKNAENDIKAHNEALKEIQEVIDKKKLEIKADENKLGSLITDEQKAVKELEEQKPHINRAREIKVKLEAAKEDVKEKENAMETADSQKKKAEKDFQDNQTAISKAKEEWEKAKVEMQKLNVEIETGAEVVKKTLVGAKSNYTAESAKLVGLDATNLQDAKEAAEKIQSDLKEAIHIQNELESKTQILKQNTIEKERLSSRNSDIKKELEGFDTESLVIEVETLTKTYTLMSSENWAMHRNNLNDGEPCPLCGAIHHPYHDEKIVVPIVDNLKTLIDKKQGLLDKQNSDKQKLMQEQGKNNGTLEGIKRTLETIGEEISNLNTAWAIIHNAHSDWPEDAGSLCDMQEKIDKVAEDAGLALTKYNKLVKQVESLRIAKEKAEKDEREYQDRATKLVKIAETKVTDANTLFSTEKGKTKNLQEQLNDRTAALESATAVLNKAKEEVRVKESELKAEIGDKNPDIYEKTLSQTKEQAEKAVKEQNKFIAGQYENLKELQGKEKTTKEYRETENERMTTARKALEQWIDAYNNKEDKLQVLTVDDIARFYSATDDWESMRARQKQLNEECTAAYTMWRNSQEVYGEHQNKKPKQSKEELAADLKTLENRSSDELVDIKARIQRHDQAKSQMGALFEQKQKAELLKNEWGQITSAIGPDGKTLRKIAQCYTLRFLIEHANAEIRKFNNRYELQQVKNSLGIRVIDHDRADDVRDITSLSGGETFIVSLGLALGLSSLSSRNLSFSNLFIDEGFGTLDPDTLATVIDSLAMLQTSQGKKVGVISHTDTMSERITTQIRIIKNGNSGSSHIEIHA